MNAPITRVSDIFNISDTSECEVNVHHTLGGRDPRLSEAELVLLTLHDGGLAPFVQECASSYGYPAGFDEYVHVERDVGTRDLVSHLLQQVSGAIWLDVVPARGVVDVNRHPHLAIELSQLDHSVWNEELLRLHGRITRAIRRTLDSTPKARAVLDIHSMSPGSPQKSIPPPQWAALGQHVARWRTAARRGERRDTDLIDALEDGTIVGNRRLSEILATGLSEGGIRSAYNTPYAKSLAHHPVDFIAHPKKPGVSVDFPKDLLATSPGGGFDLVDCQPDTQKVAVITEIVRDAVARYLSRG